MDFLLHRVARASLRALFVYSMMMAIYLTVNSIVHPATMAMPLTHVLTWPTERSVLEFAWPCSVLSFFLLRAAAHVSKSCDGGDCG